jgi:hypothetical protein
MFTRWLLLIKMSGKPGELQRGRTRSLAAIQMAQVCA